MPLTEEQQLRIKENALAHAQAICNHYEVVTHEDLLTNAKKVEEYIREGIGG